MKSNTLRVGIAQYAPKWLDKKGTFEVIEKTPAILANGGSCIAGPDGEWVLEPQIGIEGVMVADFSLGRVYGERQNFDPSGHYSRPDVTRLVLDRSRQTILGFGEADI